MLFFGLGINKDVIKENYHELVEVFHENLVHEVHEIGWGIGQTKGHHGVFKQTVTGGEGGLGNVCLSDHQLMVSCPKIDLGKDSGSVHLIEQILDLGKRILIFNGHVIQLAIIHTQACGTVSLVHEYDG